MSDMDVVAYGLAAYFAVLAIEATWRMIKTILVLVNNRRTLGEGDLSS